MIDMIRGSPVLALTLSFHCLPSPGRPDRYAPGIAAEIWAGYPCAMATLARPVVKELSRESNDKRESGARPNTLTNL